MMELVYVDGPSFRAPFPTEVSDAVALKVVEIKGEASRRITALDWRLQRSQEREQLGETGVETGVETVADVLALREQIRQASNAAEAAVRELESVEEVISFSW